MTPPKSYGLHVQPRILEPTTEGHGSCQRVINSSGAIVTEARTLPEQCSFPHKHYEELFKTWCMTVLTITVPDKSTATVDIRSSYTPGNSAESWKCSIGKNATLTLKETTTGMGDLHKHITIIAHEGSKGTITSISALRGGTRKSTTITCHEKSTINHSEIHKGTMTFTETKSILAGEESTSNLSTTYFLEGNNHFDHHSTSEHHAKRTTSTISTRGAIKDHARADIIGNVRITPEADESSGYQSSTALLLSPTATINQLPNLEIHNHNVTCSHSASVTTIDEEHTHYLASRGIPPFLARTILTQGFLDKSIQQLPPQFQEEARRFLGVHHES